MVFVNCVIEENSPTQASIDICANVNCISQKHINELGIAYHSESNSIETPDASHFTLGKVNLQIGFNDGPWFQENGATMDICNSKLLLDDNFVIPFKIQHILFMAHSSVINLPELLEQILYFLAIDKSLYSTLYVCRFWYRCGAPILWRRIELKGEYLYPGQSLPNDYNYSVKDRPD
ncbi:hypothetical protein RhiirC2_800096 [Rhizophagus irregularis]|uniref:F-box domain-containing protein n=1 Tax=Rhizophagus irregularis TaxID=588596 RepID=A0A2N1M447_9GLOM|nr:hypothetical protein RhiirC2_800096 [Rhizophagus irregularis]